MPTPVPSEFSRRQFLARSAALSAGMALAAPALRAAAFGRPPADTYFDWITLKAPAGLSAAVAVGAGGNSLLLVSKGEALLLDTKNIGFAPELDREARARAPFSTLTVVNSHHHPDHTGGNPFFIPAEHTTTIAHVKLPAHLPGQMNKYISGIKEAANLFATEHRPRQDDVARDVIAQYRKVTQLTAKDFTPTRLIAVETPLTIGGVKARVFPAAPAGSAGRAHTDNDLALRFDDANILAVGDLLFHGMHPVVDVEGGASVLGWTAALVALEKTCDAKTIVIPGSGSPTDVKGLRQQIAYFTAARAAVEKALAAKRSDEQIEQLKIPGFESLAEDSRRPAVLAALRDELKSPPAAPTPS